MNDMYLWLLYINYVVIYRKCGIVKEDILLFLSAIKKPNNK
jgi:hypothetical protein